MLSVQCPGYLLTTLSSTATGQYLHDGQELSVLRIHLNEEILLSPHQFNPDSFLEKDGQKKKKYLVPFSRGTRRSLVKYSTKL